MFQNCSQPPSMCYAENKDCVYTSNELTKPKELLKKYIRKPQAHHSNNMSFKKLLQRYMI